ncbi:MAG TPA: hypothetical protein PK264_10435 [Hyphomicrobiaceae bacterium]|nr:hypothetical protein [Hyphomicrobiaceae bacterium]
MTTLSTTVATASHGVAADANFEGKQHVGRPILTRIGDGFVGLYRLLTAGQEARANRFVRPHLARQDDATLKTLGLSDAEIAKLRHEAADMPRIWL